MTTATKVQSTSIFAFDWSGAQIGQSGLPPEALQNFSSQLIDVRNAFFKELEAYDRKAAIPAARQPRDMGFFQLPERMLQQYEADRKRSELARILIAARRLRDVVDRVVVLDIGGSCMGARALFESCCHPYHNELSRGQRGGSPRIYFQGNHVDNDAAAGLLELLGNGRLTSQIDDAWGLVVIRKRGGTLETDAVFRIFLHALRSSCRDNLAHAAARFISVTEIGSKLHRLGQALGVTESFPVPDGVAGPFSVFSAVGLVPAAVLGIDVVKLLQGAVSMNEHFRHAPPGNNRALDYMAVNHLMEIQRGAHIRVMSVWSKSLEALGRWYDQLLAESLGKHQPGATPRIVIQTLDPHSVDQPHREGARDKINQNAEIIHNVIVQNWRQDPLAIGTSPFDQDGLNRIADQTLPQIMAAAIQGTHESDRDNGRPHTDIRLPQVNEYHIGQLMQMWMIATTLEGLISRNKKQKLP